MDAAAGCSYFANNSLVTQILANGTNAPTAGQTLTMPFGTVWQILIDPTDPLHHYLYALCASGSSNRLYKIDLSQFPLNTSILGYAGGAASDPPLYPGAIDVAGGFYTLALRWLTPAIRPPSSNLRSARARICPRASAPRRLDTELRGLGASRWIQPAATVCCTDGNETNFGEARVYMFRAQWLRRAERLEPC